MSFWTIWGLIYGRKRGCQEFCGWDFVEKSGDRNGSCQWQYKQHIIPHILPLFQSFPHLTLPPCSAGVNLSLFGCQIHHFHLLSRLLVLRSMATVRTNVGFLFLPSFCASAEGFWHSPRGAAEVVCLVDGVVTFRSIISSYWSPNSFFSRELRPAKSLIPRLAIPYLDFHSACCRTY